MTETGRAKHFLSPDAPLNDNIALREYFEHTRATLHMGGVILGGISAQLDARLRKVNPLFMVAGMSSRYRARMVSAPFGKAAEALFTAAQYVLTADNRFMAGFSPELEAAGHKEREQFTFKAG